MPYDRGRAGTAALSAYSESYFSKWDSRPVCGKAQPTGRDNRGTWILSVLSGHRRYSHVSAIRCDGVNPGLLGMG